MAVDRDLIAQGADRAALNLYYRVLVSLAFGALPGLFVASKGYLADHGTDGTILVVLGSFGLAWIAATVLMFFPGGRIIRNHVPPNGGSSLPPE